MQTGWWRYWKSVFKSNAARSHRRRSRHHSAEALETRLVLSGVAPTARDDATSFVPMPSGPQNFLGGAIQIDVLKNDVSVSGRLDYSSLTIVDGPAHGSANVLERDFLAGNDLDGSLVTSQFSVFTGFNGLVNDNGSPVGNGFASAVSGEVDDYGQIKLAVSSSIHNRVFYGNAPFEDGDYAMFVRLGERDFARFDATAFDFSFHDRVDAPVDLSRDNWFDHSRRFQRFNIDDQVPGTPFIAWIDNTVGNGTPDTVLQKVGPWIIHYEPEPGFVGTDVIRYTVRDTNGRISNVATVRLTVQDLPPVAHDRSVSTFRNEPVEIADLAADLDGTIDPASIVFTTPPSHGTVEALSTSEGLHFVYTPAQNSLNADVFKFQVKDDRGVLSNIATVRVNVLNHAPTAGDDAASVALNKSAVIDVLANDSDADGTLMRASLKIESNPRHGTALVRSTATGPVIDYRPKPGFLGPDEFSYSVRDNNGAIANATVVVNQAPIAGSYTASTPENTSVRMDVLANDVAAFQDGSIDRSSLLIHSQPARGKVLLRQTVSGPVVEYTPNRGTSGQLLVDDLVDTDDGNYSPGHLSLREAIRLANADRYTDSFTYTVKDSHGIVSSPATVTVDVLPGATTIRFSPQLYQTRKFNLPLTRIGDTSEGNSALAVSSQISIIGNPGRNLMTLTGRGNSSDLRLFLVKSEGQLTLQNIGLTQAGTDGSGAAIYVQSGGTATLTNCSLSYNFAFDRGGAIFNLGTLLLSNSELSDNQAELGGAITNIGRLTLNNSNVIRNRADDGGGLNNEQGIANLKGTTFANNSATGRGGGFFDAGTVVAVNSTFSLNSAEEGGGFYTVGQVHLTDSRLTQNHADAGGGFANGSGTPIAAPVAERSGTVTLIHADVRDNDARLGGGFHSLGNVAISDSEISRNSARQGGGFYLSDFGLRPSNPTLVTVTRSTISQNQATDGAGVYIDLGAVRLENSTLSGNSATKHGGGLLNNSSATLINTTVGGNSAKAGGGLYNGFGHLVVASSTVADNSAILGGGLYNDAGFVNLQSTIVAGNQYSRTASDIAGSTAVDHDSSQNNLIGSGGSGGLENGVGGNIVGVAPLLSKLGKYGGTVATFALLPGSPAIDAGAGEGNDARGVAPVGLRDIGAFESHGFMITAEAGSGQTARANSVFVRSLQVLVTARHPEEPVIGGTVSFDAPVSGASAQLSPSQAPIAENHRATVGAKANRIAGTYVVTAHAAGISAPAAFRLTNTGNAGPALIPRAEDPPLALTKLVDSQQPSSVSNAAIPSAAGYTTLPTDRTEYRLTGSHQLLRRSPGSVWTVLVGGVLHFEKGLNGDLYLLNDQNELKRLQLGTYWSTLQTGVRTFEMSPSGRLFVLDHLHNMRTYASLDRYYILPSSESPLVALDPPSFGEVIEAGSIASGGVEVHTVKFGDTQIFPFEPGMPLQRELDSLFANNATLSSPDDSLSDIPGPESHLKWFNNIRMVVEPINDSAESPKYFPSVGWAQLHHAHYKATIYGDAAADGKQTQIIVFIDHDHLHLVAPHSVVAGTELTGAVNVAASDPKGATAVPTYQTVGHVRGTGIRESYAPKLVKGSDGTVYRMGIIDNGDIGYVKSDPGPYNLWRLVPGDIWEQLHDVRAMEVAPDGTLYALSASYEWQSLRSETRQWTTLGRDFQSMAMTPDGTVYALKADGNLQQWSAKSRQRLTLAANVSEFAVLSDGTLYSLNDRQQLLRLYGKQWITVSNGVTSFAQIDDALYTLNRQGQLKRLSAGNGWKVIGTGALALNAAFDGTFYVLETHGNLKRISSTGQLDLIHRGVDSFQVAPNGDLYLLTNRQELKRLKLGYSWSTLQSGVKTFQIDDYGTVFAHDNFNRVKMYSSDSVLVVNEPIGMNLPHFAHDLPSEHEIVSAAAIGGLGGQGVEMPDNLFNDVQYFPAGPDDLWLLHQRDSRASAWNNVRLVIEPMVDRVDPPRYFKNIGLAQLHHAQYKCTIYGSTLIAHPASNPDNIYVNEDEVSVIYIDRDHLHLYEPGTAQRLPDSLEITAETSTSHNLLPTDARRVDAQPLARSGPAVSPSSGGPAVQRRRDELAQSLTTAPDGTIYKLGGGQTGNVSVGSEPGPYFLWQHPSNGDWTPIDYVYSFGLGPDSRLYILDANRDLRTPNLGNETWQTLAKSVETFHIASDGTLFVLNDKHELRTQLPGSRQWATTEYGVTSLMATPAGAIYTINDRFELRQLAQTNHWAVIDRGVQSFAMVSDGTMYFVNEKRRLIRLSEDRRRTTLANDVQTFQVAPDGGVYALSTQRELMKLTARDHWTVVVPDVRKFQIAPNGDLYLINEQYTLLRQNAGYSWTPLQTDVRSFQIFSDGTVYAFDSHQKPTLYSSSGPYFVSGPVENDERLNPPSAGEIVAAANLYSPSQQFPFDSPGGGLEGDLTDPAIQPITAGRSAKRSQAMLRHDSTFFPVPNQLTVENIRIVAELVPAPHQFDPWLPDPPRFVTNLGAAQLHRVRYKVTIYFNRPGSRLDEQLVIYIDRDHFHLRANLAELEQNSPF